jgi:ribosomal protein S18 acetylase RimI-like enzyme
MRAQRTAGLSPSGATFRKATRADLATLFEFRMAMLADIFSKRGTEQGEANERWLDQHLDRDFVAWIADVQGRAVACAGLMWFAHPPGPVNPAGKEAYILNVYTRPEARRKGLARALMDLAVGEARAAGTTRIWLRASAEGRPLYEAMGFRGGNYMQLVPEELEDVVGRDEGVDR